MRRLPIPLLLATLLLAGCQQQQLLRDLSEQQANDVVAILQEHNLTVDKQEGGKSGFIVSVEQADFPAAVDILHKYNLPARERVEISQAFPSDALVASPQAEQARLLSTIEQRLEQTLASIDNVTTARVQLSYPLQQSLGTSKEPAMHASVLLTYRNEVDENLLVSEVKRFVKNSFANIDYDNISVIMFKRGPIYRNAATQATGSGRLSWLYGLLLIPLAAVALAIGRLIWKRRRQEKQDQDANRLPPADTSPSRAEPADAPEVRPDGPEQATGTAATAPKQETP